MKISLPPLILEIGQIRPKRFLVFASSLFACMLSVCYADAGLPMIIPGMIFMICALIPVIFIETFVFHKGLGLTYKKTLGPVSVGNIVSTFLGYPLSWLFLFAVELCIMFMVTKSHLNWPNTGFGNIVGFLLGSAWIGPVEGKASYWALPAALMVGLIPAYFISVHSESLVLKRFFRELDPILIKKVSYRAHAVTYALFYVALGIFILYWVCFYRRIF